ncbi:DNA-processing protein DprA [Patescibacteria group bacterium]|nr:DNA-processing protein DprA [Patescibacteria group bacterium]MBU0964446.1 DNA-processing protein DprA [Patescibacteria group bacterium]
MKEYEETKYWVAFSHIESIGPKKFKMLYNHFSSMKNAWRASYSELHAAGLTNKDAETIFTKRGGINPDKLWEDLTENNIQVITIKHANYPHLLKQIHLPPALLYVKGQWPVDSEYSLAVVGTRKTSSYGRQAVLEITSELSKAGLTIISGLALGIDALAHQAALEAGGITIAVLGCGLDIIYPATNRQLSEKILREKGALISEYPPGTQPLKYHFPARNRIISGLSKGVLVIEGGQDSGSLITANFALEQNREVFAVPGNIFSQSSRGPNKLIKMGASVVTSANDILQALNIEQAQQFKTNKKIIPASQEEKIILEYLSSEALHIDEIIKSSKLKSSIVNSCLTMLEMKGFVRNLGGAYYVLSD